MAAVESLFGHHVHDKDNKTIDLKTHCAGKVVGIYFSAHWCGPCRAFTPQLAKFYNNHHTSKNFEIIFVSADNDEKSFKDYYNEMPWLTLDFNNIELNTSLNTKYNVEGIPTLVLINGDNGELYNSDGTVSFNDDPNGEKFPWPQEKIQKPSCFIAMC